MTIEAPPRVDREHHSLKAIHYSHGHPTMYRVAISKQLSQGHLSEESPKEARKEVAKLSAIHELLRLII